MRLLTDLFIILLSPLTRADKSGYYITTNIEDSSVTFLGIQTDLDSGFNLKGGYDFGTTYAGISYNF